MKQKDCLHRNTSSIHHINNVVLPRRGPVCIMRADDVYPVTQVHIYHVVVVAAVKPETHQKHTT